MPNDALKRSDQIALLRAVHAKEVTGKWTGLFTYPNCGYDSYDQVSQRKAVNSPPLAEPPSTFSVTTALIQRPTRNRFRPSAFHLRLGSEPCRKCYKRSFV